MRVLLLEDDAALARGLTRSLRTGGFAVDHFSMAADALFMAVQDIYSALIIDLTLPDMPGLDVLKMIRGKRLDTPVMILTARDTLEERIAGLDAGADDYQVKPFYPTELQARLRALIRRHQGRSQSGMVVGSLNLDLNGALSVDDVPVDLRRRELSVLRTLMSRAGKVVSRDRLISDVFGIDDEVAPNALEVQVARLRPKIEHSTHQIRTLRGLGYMLDAKSPG